MWSPTKRPQWRAGAGPRSPILTTADADAGPPPVADSDPAGTSNLFERDAQLAEAPKCSDIRRWHGVIGAVWHELTEPSALKTAFESCLPGDMPSLGRRPSSPGIGSSWLTQQSRPWRADALPPILALGTLLKERDGLLWGGWTERTFVLMQNGQLLYYLRTPDSNDEVALILTPTLTLSQTLSSCKRARSRRRQSYEPSRFRPPGPRTRTSTRARSSMRAAQWLRASCGCCIALCSPRATCASTTR